MHALVSAKAWLWALALVVGAPVVAAGGAAVDAGALRASGCAPPAQFSATEVVGALSGEIAFATARNGTSDVYVMDRNGRRERPLTRNGPPASAVDWPADCRFAFAADTPDGITAIWVASADTRQLRRIVAGDEPSWSPRGATI